MDNILLIVGIIVVIGFIMLSFALSSENRTKSDYERSKAERERAEAERERAARDRELAVARIAQDKALALTNARTTAEQKIVEADRQSVAFVFEKAEQAGGLSVKFDELRKDNGDYDPLIEWEWSPFGKAALKIHRNTGGIIEEIEDIKEKTELIFVETEQSSGTFQDKDAHEGTTYNYYVFIEARREGMRAKEVTLPIPSQFGDGEVIDQQGNRITKFDTVEPEAYTESLYFGLKSKRITVSVKEDEFASERRELNRRKTKIEIGKLDAKLAKMEKEMDQDGRELTEDDLEDLLAEAKIKKKKRERRDALIARIENDPDLNAEEKDELIEQILARRT